MAPLHVENHEINKSTFRAALFLRAKRRRKAAEELYNFGLESRTSVEPRGTLSSPASSPFSNSNLEKDMMGNLKRMISDSDTEVRLLAVNAAVHVGDDTLVEALRTRLQAEESHEIKLAAISALGEIGGLEAIEALADVVEWEPKSEESEDARFEALGMLEELSGKDFVSGPDVRFNPEEVTPQPEVLEILEDPLRKIVFSEPPGLFRIKARDILEYLGSGVV